MTQFYHGSSCRNYNRAMTITLTGFQAFAQKRMSESIANPDQFRDRFTEIMNFAVANETAMDAEANAYFNNLLDTIAAMFEHGLKNVADSPDKRRMLRAIAGTRRKHHRSQDFLKRLGMPYRSFLRRISPFWICFGMRHSSHKME